MKTSMFSKFFRCIWFYSRSVHWTLLERSMVALEVNTYQPYMRRLSKQFDIWGKRFFSNGSLSQHSSLSLLLLQILAKTYFFWSININWAIVANWSVEKILHLELPPPWVAQIWQKNQDVIVLKENWNYWRICQKSSLQLRTGPINISVIIS